MADPNRTRAAALVLAALLASSAPAWAQDDPAPPPPAKPFTYTDGPVSMVVAMAGVVVASAGFGLMLRTTGPCYCEPRTAWVVGGVIVVAAGVTMTWLGLRDKRVTVFPIVTPTAGGAVAVIRWGGRRPDGSRP
jgi:type IV secretory pathway VirB2 component (pilin)